LTPIQIVPAPDQVTVLSGHLFDFFYFFYFKKSIDFVKYQFVTDLSTFLATVKNIMAFSSKQYSFSDLDTDPAKSSTTWIPAVLNQKH
jgi:hypothetical protein